MLLIVLVGAVHRACLGLLLVLAGLLIVLEMVLLLVLEGATAVA